MAQPKNLRSKNDRRAAADKIRREQKRADQRQGAIIVGVCVVIALLIVGLTAYRPVKDWWDLRKFNDLQLAEIGAAASVCGEVTTEESAGNQHVPTGAAQYEQAPPATGNHVDRPAPFDKWFYTEDDRPPLENLVHNQEHGYTVVWYDETIAEDQDKLVQLEAVAKKFNELAGDSDSPNMRAKFKVVPWTSEDGGSFPDDQHIAITHWSRGGADVGDRSKEIGVRQYCSEFSGEALQDFMQEYPYTDSPEPTAG